MVVLGIWWVCCLELVVIWVCIWFAGLSFVGLYVVFLLSFCVLLCLFDLFVFGCILCC